MFTQKIAKQYNIDLYHPYTFDETIGDPNAPDNLKGAFVRNEVTFTNMEVATEVATYFKKNKKYPFPPPKPKDHKDKDYYSRFKDSRHYNAYKQFWDREENRRRNGLILPNAIDENGNRRYILITGRHYGYLNYQRLLRDSDAGVDESIFDDDEIKRPAFAKATGESEIDFPDFWDGDYYYFHALELALELGMHLVANKCRQVGFSYKNAWVATNEFNLYPNGTTLIGAYDFKYLNDGDATMNMTKNNVSFLNEYTDWKKGILANNATEFKSGYTFKGTKDEYGFKSKILAVSFGPANDGAARGKKGKIFMFEEAGKFPNLIKSIVATEKSLREGSKSTGSMIVFGTGGGEDVNWEGFEKIFYDPIAYNFVPFQNIWDEGMGHTACGFFHPRWQNLKPFMDKDGNTDKVAALKAVEKEREIWRAGGDELYNTNVAEYPICPSESFLRGVTNIFTCSELTDHYKQVTVNPDYRYAHHGIISHGKQGLKFVKNDQLTNPHPPIEDYPHKKGQDLTGCVTIWDYPYRNDMGVIPDKLYYIVHDPYATDKDSKEITVKNSLGAAYVYESMNNFTPSKGDKLVAKYVGRPERTDDYNKTLFNLAKYYNAEIWFENDRGDVISYAKRFKLLDYLCFEPDFDDIKEIQGKTGRKYGVSIGSSNGRRKANAAIYTRDWLMTIRERCGDFDDTQLVDGELVGRQHGDLLNLHYINDPRLLKEFIKWQKDGNFDCVSSIFVLMLCIKEIESKAIVAKESTESDKTSFINLDNIINSYGS